MKKLTLTFCALFAVLVVAPAIYADGPERTSGKEKEVMQPAPPVCDFYRAHEWDLDIWGAYAFGGTTGQFDVPNEDPFASSINGGPFLTPDNDPTIFGPNGAPVEPQISNFNEHINIGQVSKNEMCSAAVSTLNISGVDTLAAVSKLSALPRRGILPAAVWSP